MKVMKAKITTPEGIITKLPNGNFIQTTIGDFEAESTAKEKLQKRLEGMGIEVLNIEFVQPEPIRVKEEKKEVKAERPRRIEYIGYGEDEGDYVPHNFVSSIVGI